MFEVLLPALVLVMEKAKNCWITNYLTKNWTG